MRFLNLISITLIMLSAGGLCWGQTHQDEMPTRTLDHVQTAVSRVALNDNGWGVWATGRGNDSQVFLWDGEKVRPLGFAGRNNRDPAINQNNWVVWAADRTDGSGSSDVYLWKNGGEPICLSAKLLTGAEPHLNNRGDVVWWGCAGGKNEGIADVFLLANGAKSPVNLTGSDREGASRSPCINDSGTVSYERSHKKKGQVVTDLVIVNVSNPKKRTQITDSNDQNVTNGGINTAGELVWEQWTDDTKNWHVYKYSPKGRPLRLTDWRQADRMPCLIENGDVAWHTNYLEIDAGSSLLHRRSGDTLEQIPVKYVGQYTRPVAINNRGQVLYASGDGSETGFDVILAGVEVEAERKPCGMLAFSILFWGVCGSVALIRKMLAIWRRRSQKLPPLLPH